MPLTDNDVVAHKRHQNLCLSQKGPGGGKTVHDGHSCTRCSICGQQSQKYGHISSKQDLSSELKDKICNAFKISVTSCLCIKCYLKVLIYKEQKDQQTSASYPCELQKYGLCQGNGKKAMIVKLNIFYQCFQITNIFACSLVDDKEEKSVYFCDEHRLKLGKYLRQLKCSKCCRSLTREVHYVDPEMDTFVRSHPELGKKDIRDSFVLGSPLCTGCYTYIKELCTVNAETVSSHSDNIEDENSHFVEKKGAPTVFSIQESILNSTLLLEDNVSFRQFVLSICNSFLNNQVFLASELFTNFVQSGDGTYKS